MILLLSREQAVNLAFSGHLAVRSHFGVCISDLSVVLVIIN